MQAQLGWKNPESNRAHLAHLLAAAESPFDLAVLPETFATGFLGDSGLDDETMDGPTVGWMLDQCRRHRCALAGSIVISEGGRSSLAMAPASPPVPSRRLSAMRAFCSAFQRRAAMPSPAR